MIPTRYTDMHVGDMFVVRNAGNIIPHSHHFQDEYFSCEPAALELGCIVNSIRHVIVCGHSDCKAMNLLYTLKNPKLTTIVNFSCFSLFLPLNLVFILQNERRISPLKAWLYEHAATSLDRFLDLKERGLDRPLLFSSETPTRKFIAYIDPDNQFAIEDKLSQVNTLEQLSNIASYGFLKKRLETFDLHLHALWFDIYTGEVFYFSRASKRFVPINERTIDDLLQEVQKFYS